LFTVFDLQHDFPNEWYQATELPPVNNTRQLILNKLLDRLPVFTKSHQPSKVKAMDVIVMTSSPIQASALFLNQNGTDNPFDNGVDIGTFKAFAMHDMNMTLDKWVLKLTDTTTPLHDMWLVVRYVLE
jgi:hypothetical protein